MAIDIQIPEFTFFKGRVALLAILDAAGIGPGDQVLLPGYTCVVVPNSILYVGAEPVFIDILPDTFNLAPQAVKAYLQTPEAGNARAIVVQHTYGIPCDFDEIREIASEKGLLLIEDSCHALGSTYKNRPVGSLGDASFFSTQWSKPVTTGLGGWAIINDPVLSEQMAATYANYSPPGLVGSTFLFLQFLAFTLLNRPHLFWLIQGFYRTLGRLGLVSGSSSSEELECRKPPNFKKSMGRIQAWQLGKLLDGFTSQIPERKRQAQLVGKCLAESGFSPLDLPGSFDPVLLRYPVKVRNKAEVLDRARKARVKIGDWFASPIHPNTGGWELASYRKGSCPVAEQACATIVNIPLGANMDDAALVRCVKFLEENACPIPVSNPRDEPIQGTAKG